MRHETSWRDAVVVAVVLLLTSIGPARSVDVGEPAPPFHVEDLDGTIFDSSELQGTVLLLFFLDPTNPYCVAEAPQIEAEIWQAFSWHNFQLLGIHTGVADRDAMLAFRQATGVTFPLVPDGEAVAQAYGTPANSFVLVDAQGVVRYVSLGPGPEGCDMDAMKEAVTLALEGVSPPKESTWGRIKKLFEEGGSIR
jgi:peroxiredoxin